MSPQVVVLADDLTGAVEAAAALAGLTGATPRTAAVQLGPGLAVSAADIVAVDLDTRTLTPEAAWSSLQPTLDQARGLAGEYGLVLKKIDSLWRGNTVADVTALAAAGPAVLVPALPALGRTVRDGRLHGVAGGTPAAGASTDLTALLGGRVSSIPLRVVRAVKEELTAWLDDAVGAGRLPLVDAETDHDLDLVAEALLSAPGRLIIGTGGIAQAIGRRLSAVPASPPDAVPGLTGPVPPAPPPPITVLVGSTADAARAQLAHLRDPSVAVFTSPLPAAPADDDGAWSRRLVAAALAHEPGADFVVTGGATARALLDALGVALLYPLAETHPGAVVSRTADGRLVATRPGSFGGPDSLARLVDHLRALRKALP